MDVREEQPLNALEKIDVTAGMVIVVSEVQL